MFWQWLTNLKTIITALLRLESMMGAVSEALAGVSDQLAKAKTEIVGRITDLETQLANGGPLSPEDQAAIDAVKSAAQALDDVIPDAPVEPTEPPSDDNA